MGVMGTHSMGVGAAFSALELVDTLLLLLSLPLLVDETLDPLPLLELPLELPLPLLELETPLLLLLLVLLDLEPLLLLEILDALSLLEDEEDIMPAGQIFSTWTHFSLLELLISLVVVDSLPPLELLTPLLFSLPLLELETPLPLPLPPLLELPLTAPPLLAPPLPFDPGMG